NLFMLIQCKHCKLPTGLSGSIQILPRRHVNYCMNLNNFTNKAQEAVVAAQTLAQEYNHTEIEPAHLMLALLRQIEGVVPQVIAKIGTRPTLITTELEKMLQGKPQVYGSGVEINLQRATVDVLSRAEREAKKMKDDFVSTEHILLALTEDKVIGELLLRHGIDHDSALKALMTIRGGQRVNSQDPEGTYQSL